MYLLQRKNVSMKTDSLNFNSSTQQKLTRQKPEHQIDTREYNVVHFRSMVLQGINKWQKFVKDANKQHLNRIQYLFVVLPSTVLK
jgi:hypothetical protein